MLDFDEKNMIYCNSWINIIKYHFNKFFFLLEIFKQQNFILFYFSSKINYFKFLKLF